MGLREIKKQQTRQLITDTAWRLFADRGFDGVTVVEVAHEAQVSEATVFNHFRTKEDLFYSPLEAFGTRLVEAVGARQAGEPALAAFRRFLQGNGGLLEQVEDGDVRALDRLRTINRVIAGSPALLARERQSLAATTEALAAALSDRDDRADRADGDDRADPADDVNARVVANALMGVHRTLLEYVRRRVLADEGPDRLAADVRELSESAFELLERGLGGYPRKA